MPATRLRSVAEEWGGTAMRRVSVIVALGALLGMFGGLLAASPALAGRGHKWQVSSTPAITLPAGACGFRVRVNPVASKEFIKVLKAPDGSMMFLGTGTLKVSYTNLSTGKTITVNRSGPAKDTIHPDGSVTFAARGHFAIFLSHANAQRFGLPTVSVTAGRATLSLDANGALTSVSLRGHVLVDVCAALR